MQHVSDVNLRRRVVSQEVGFQRDARGRLGGAAGGSVSAASFGVQTLLVSFDGGFQARLQVRRRRDEGPDGRKDNTWTYIF